MIKVIGIGNLLMGDDGISLKIIDSIEEELKKLNLSIECIKAETDFNYALDNIQNGDLLFILDSTLLGLECGQITKISLNEFGRYSSNLLSVHGMSLLSLINHSNIEIEGFILGIEVVEVGFSLEITNGLKIKFKEICSEVYKIIKANSLEYMKKGETSA